MLVHPKHTANTHLQETGTTPSPLDTAPTFANSNVRAFRTFKSVLVLYWVKSQYALPCWCYVSFIKCKTIQFHVLRTIAYHLPEHIQDRPRERGDQRRFPSPPSPRNHLVDPLPYYHLDYPGRPLHTHWPLTWCIHTCSITTRLYSIV